jgi:hypothetical protein
VGATVTTSGTGVPSGSVTLDAAVNVPSLPSHDSAKVIGSRGPDDRVNVMVRSSRCPARQPSRSHRLTPSWGRGSQAPYCVRTGPRLAMAIAGGVFP